MEAIVVLVGFLGVGKTTLLKRIVEEYLNQKWSPYIILNDYENANLDAQDFLKLLGQNEISALSGSCICCTGVNELRQKVNDVPSREKGITLIEANGTTDAVSLMGFLGVGMKEHFLPPVQIAIVDVREWQQRGQNNELEANQVQVSSMIILNYIDQVSSKRLAKVKKELCLVNPQAILIHWDDLDIKALPELHPSTNEAKKMDHHKAHWSSCSVDLPDPISSDRLYNIVESIPKEILRLKGCTRIDDNEGYTYFERIPNGEMIVRPYSGRLVSGPKLLAIGPGSDPKMLQELIDKY